MADGWGSGIVDENVAGTTVVVVGDPPSDGGGVLTSGGTPIGFGIDDFNRILMTPVESFTDNTSWPQDTQHRSVLMQMKNRSILTSTHDAGPPGLESGAGLLPFDCQWATSLFGAEFLRPIGSSSILHQGAGFYNDPVDTNNYHYDFEGRWAFALFGAGDLYPTNCTHFQLLAPDGLGDAQWLHAPGEGDVTVDVYNGIWPPFGVPWGGGVLGGSFTLLNASNNPAVPVSVATPTGVPWTMFVVSQTEAGVGTKYIRDDDTLDVVPPIDAHNDMPRYPNEKHADPPFVVIDILGHPHLDWALNDARKGTGPIGVPRQRIFYPFAPGWGGRWDERDATGDDWSDFAQVNGSEGILRVHPPGWSGERGFAGVTDSTPLPNTAPGVNEISFGVRFNVLEGPSSPYFKGLYAGCGFSLGATVGIYPDNDIIDFGPFSVAGGMIWTETVYFHVREDNAGSYVSWWQAGQNEPSAWTLTSTFNYTGFNEQLNFQLSPSTTPIGVERIMYVLGEAISGGGAPCGLYLDNFQRSTANGWGVATPDGITWPGNGGAWVTGLPQSCSVSVGAGRLAPGVGVLSPSGAGVRVGVDIDAGLDGGVPWPLETHIAFHIDKSPSDLPPGPSGNCNNVFAEMAVSATFSDVAYVNGTGSVAFQHVKVGTTRTSQVRVFSKSISGALTSQDIVLPFTLSAGSWEGRARFTPFAAIQYKVWPSSTAEPGWSTSTVVLDGGWNPVWLTTGASNPVLAFGDPGYFLVETVSQIDFNYVDKDCGGGGGGGGSTTTYTMLDLYGPIGTGWGR